VIFIFTENYFVLFRLMSTTSAWPRLCSGTPLRWKVVICFVCFVLFSQFVTLAVVVKLEKDRGDEHLDEFSRVLQEPRAKVVGHVKQYMLFVLVLFQRLID
jgi:hypothetical protein